MKHPKGIRKPNGTGQRRCCIALTAVLALPGVFTLRAEVKPFATDMYVKSPDFGYYIFTWYVCPESFRWSWYTWHVDLNGRGPVVNPEAMAGVRTLHERSPLFWCAANSGLARVQAGIVSWNPAAYDPDLCDRATAQAFFGTGAYEQQRVIETALMPIIGYIGAYRAPNSMEWNLQTIPRRTGPSKKEFSGYRRNFEAAERALADLEKAFANQRTPFDRPDIEDRRDSVLRQYRETLDKIRRHLPQ